MRQQLSSMADQFLAAIFGHDDAAADLAGGWEARDGLEEGADELEEALELDGAARGGGDDDDEGGGLTWDATPEEVVRRINSVTLWFLDQLRSGELPDIELASRSAGRWALTTAGGGSEEEDGESGSGQQQQAQRHTLALLGRHPDSADALARLFLLLAAVQEQLLSGAQATQRELWYRLKTMEVRAGHWVLGWRASGAA